MEVSRRWLILGEGETTEYDGAIDDGNSEGKFRSRVRRVRTGAALGRMLTLTTLHDIAAHLSNFSPNNPLPSLYPEATGRFIPSCEVSDRAVAIRIEAKDNEPELVPGDFVVADPAEKVLPGDLILIASVWTPAAIRRYERTDTGGAKLSALNPAWGSETIDAKKFSGAFLKAPVLQWTKNRRA